MKNLTKVIKRFSKKIKIILGVCLTLVLLSSLGFLYSYATKVFFYSDVSNTDLRISIQNQLNMNPRLKDLEATTFYKQYKAIKLGQSVSDVEELMDTFSKVEDVGNFKAWETSYANCFILSKNSKIVTKDIIFYNLPRLNISKDQYDSVKVSDTLADVLLKLGSGIAFTESLLDSGKQIDSYMWIAKDPFETYNLISGYSYKGHTLVIRFRDNIVYDITKY